MAREKLTVAKIEKLRKPGMYRDGDATGLFIQIKPQGGKSWVLRYQINGKAHWMGLGGADIIAPEKARDAARTARALAYKGVDPISERREQKIAAAVAAANSKTFAECMELYFAAHRSEWSKSYAAGWKKPLEIHAQPLMGRLVHAIDTNAVMSVVQPIWEAKRPTAEFVRTRIELVLGYAATAHYRDEDVPNPARWGGHLENLLSKKSATPAKNHEMLPFAEIPSFMAKLRAIDGVTARALEFVILTGVRNEEAGGARWDEVDIAERAWMIPAERMKRRKEHRVPLSDAAIAVLEKMRAIRRNDFVFPARTSEYTDGQNLRRLLRTLHSGITVHGFRSSFSTWGQDCTSFALETREHALAHLVGGDVARRYNRGTQFEKRRELMDAWARYCNGDTAQVAKLSVAA